MLTATQVIGLWTQIYRTLPFLYLLDRFFNFMESFRGRVTITRFQLKCVHNEIFHLCDRIGTHYIDTCPASLCIHNQAWATTIVVLKR